MRICQALILRKSFAIKEIRTLVDLQFFCKKAGGICGICEKIVKNKSRLREALICRIKKIRKLKNVLE
jgi:hypothetical protein